MTTYDTESAWAYIIKATGVETGEVSEFLTAMSDYYAPQTSVPKDDRLYVDVRPAEYDFNKVLVFVFQVTELPLCKIADMMVADVAYMASVDVIPAQAAADVQLWRAFHFNLTDPEDSEKTN